MRHSLFLSFLCWWILKCGHRRNVNSNVVAPVNDAPLGFPMSLTSCLKMQEDMFAANLNLYIHKFAPPEG